jgi:hypothetical protein
VSSRDEQAGNGRVSSVLHQECVQELQKVQPDYAKVQALAAVTLVEAIQDVSQRIAELSHQIMLASRH